MSQIAKKAETMIRENKLLRSIVMIFIVLAAIFFGYIYILSCTVQ